jgi:RHS repeat-associated protein
MATQTACASNYKFTGYERDSETGLDYAFARYYNQRLGRFMSADPLGGDLTDPQSLNRYAYVTNSPTNFSDPSGMNKCAYQGTMTFSSGSAGCTGGGGATNSNLWDSMAFGFIETYDVFQGYYVNDTSDAALWQDVAYGGGEMNYLFSFSVSEGINGFGGFSSFGFSFPNVGAPRKPSCTAAQQAAANLAKLFDAASTDSMWLGFGFGAGAILAGAGEGITLGGDTPFTLTFGSLTTFFGTTSALTGSASAALNAYASGNTSAIWKFNWSGLATLAATAASSKLPFLKPWADRIGDLAGKGADLAAKAKDPCQ